MNTPLGPQGAAHQARRDEHEAAFRKRYGVHTASTDSGKLRAIKLANNAISAPKRISAAIKRVNDLLIASGRSPTFAS